MRSASNHNNSSFKKNMSTQPLSIQRLRSAAPMVPPTELTWPRTRSTRIAHALLNFVSAYMYLLRNALTHSFGFLSTILCLFAQRSIKPQLYPEKPKLHVITQPFSLCPSARQLLGVRNLYTSNLAPRNMSLSIDLWDKSRPADV